jgi:hypothetical protein
MTSDAPNEFGKLVRKYRKDYYTRHRRRRPAGWKEGDPLRLADLAEKVFVKDRKTGSPKPISTSTISRLEAGEITVSQETGDSLIDALDLDETTERKLKRVLDIEIKREQKLRKIRKKESPRERQAKFERTRDALNAIMDNREPKLKGVWLAEKLGKRPQLINFWRTGDQLPAPEAMKELAKKVFPDAGVTSREITELLKAYTYDVIMSLPGLNYLDPNDREAIAECAVNVL